MTTIRSYNKRLEALKSERSTFIPLYRELSDYHLAHRGRFLTTDRNKGYKRNTRQYNNTSRLSARTLASGMMAGITSPARPWFKLGTGDTNLNEYASVKNWLHAVQSIMYRVFSQSNIYNSLHALYSELGVFGTGAMGIYQDFDNVLRCKSYTVGSYMIATNGFDRVDTFYREYEVTVAECVKMFGIENCSRSVQDNWKKGNTESAVTVIHAVEPNDDRDMQSPLAKDKAFRSVYYEYESGNKGNENFLKRSGFDEFPIMCPRWDTVGEDIYGTDCPGMTALGDVKALQLGEKRKYQALDQLSNPTLQGPASLIKRINGAGVGQHIATDSPTDALTSVFGNWRPDLNAISAVNNEVEMRVKRSFYEDLFLMLSQSDRRQITAREVAEKQEEKLLMLGPVLERLHAELLDPTIDRTFNILSEVGVLPPAPPELQGKDLKIEYVSILAQAQRMVAVTGLERVAGFAAELSAVWPGARHKVNAEEMIDEYAESMGVNPRTIRADEEVAEINAQEQQAAQQQQMAEQAQQMATTAKTASETDVSEENALSNMMRNAGLM